MEYRLLTESEIICIYRDHGAWWTFNYAGDSTAPHAELTSGRCSDGYVDSGKVLSDPQVSDFLAWNLAACLRRRNAVLPVDWVVGSPYAAITFSFDLARHVGARHGFAEKNPGVEKGFTWTPRFAIPVGALVLQCEELVTTLGTAMGVRRAVERDNPEPVRFLPDVATIIHRPERLQGGQIDVIALVRREIKSWASEDCPLCKQGSPRLRPKNHWVELTGK